MIKNFEIRGCTRPVKASVPVPADKSISHRSIILSALSEGQTVIGNFLTAEDTLNTLAIFQQLGVPIQRENTNLKIKGVGLNGLVAPTHPLDVGNSGTGLRLILGVLAGQSFDSVITGDDSILKRPLKRVIEPLMQMGAKFSKDLEQGRVILSATDTVTAPVRVIGGQAIHSITYKMPVSSAQVKSCLLLATFYSRGITEILDPGQSRDHSEVMLNQFGVSISVQGQNVRFQGGQKLISPGHVQVPGDISSAAFWMVLACVLPDSEIVLEKIGVNFTRTGFLDILKTMGADVEQKLILAGPGEQVANFRVKSSSLRSTVISGPVIPRLIDEIPVLAVAAAFAQGTTVIKDAAELRVKESDRIETTAAMLRAFGVQVETTPDGMIIEGGSKLHPGKVESGGDHRIAMSASIMATCISGIHQINDVSCVNTSYPGFFDCLKAITEEGESC